MSLLYALDLRAELRDLKLAAGPRPTEEQIRKMEQVLGRLNHELLLRADEILDCAEVVVRLERVLLRDHVRNHS